MRRFILFSILLCWIGIISYGQQFHFVPQPFSGIGYSDTIANTAKPSSYNDTLPVAVYDQWYDYVTYANGGSVGTGTNGYYQGSYDFKSIQDIIRIGVRHNTLYVGAYKYKISLSLLKYDYSSPTVPSSVTPVDLVISYDPDSLKQYADLAVYKFSNVLKFQVVINGIYDLSTTGLPSVSRSSLAKNFFVESEVDVERHTDYAVYPIPECSYDATNRSLHVAWDCALSPSTTYCTRSAIPLGSAVEANTVNYELEWAYIDDYSADLSGSTPTYSYKFSSSSSIPYDFRHNSTRVQTTDLNYDIPLVYEHGAIVYRVRAVVPNKDSGYRDAIYLGWSLPDNGSVTAGSSCFLGQGYLITSPHSGDSLNWQYSIQFAEEGKYKHVINYFDGALHQRQTQTKLNSNNSYIVATEKAYDYEGRAVVQILPTPVQQNALGYRNDIALNSATSKPYLAADLDRLTSGGCSLPDSLPPLSTSAAANKYYSSLNSDTSGMQKFVPNAKGYPFVQSIYSPDNTNRLLWQGGAGKDLQLWKNHATRNEYVKTLQPELDVVLGTEAGYAAFYPKEVTTDPNGQTSFSIFNQGGKVVMTGLLGLPDTANKPIDLLPEYTSGDIICTDLLRGTKQHKDDGDLYISVPYYSDKSGNATKLTYSARLPAFPIGCSKYLWTSGQYTIKITDNCGAPVASKTAVIGKDSVLAIDSALSVHGDSLTTTLDKANYTVSKELRFSPYEIKDQVKQFVSDNEPTCFYDEKHFIKNAVTAADFPCTNGPYIDPCEQKRQAMLMQLYPKAKYGQYVSNSDSTFNAGDSNSIFTPIVFGGNVHAAYETGVDDSGHPITSYGVVDPHWEYSYNDTTWHSALTCNHPEKPNTPPASCNNPSTFWISDNVTYTAKEVDFRTTVYINPVNINTILLYHCGYEAGASGGEFYVNGVLDNACNGFGHPNGLHLGYNEIKFKTNGPLIPGTIGEVVALSVRFFDHDTGNMLRYQAACLSLPGTITHNGVQYGRLDTLPTQTFIDIFNDTVANALLPLHPEYCKLALCNEGDFTDQLEAMNTFQEASAANRFKLDTIIAHDPLYMNADPSAQTQIKYNLSHIRNYSRIDSAAIMMAYCNGGNVEESQHCAAYLYPSEIAAISFTSDAVEQTFFNTQKQLYLANRGLLAQQIFDGANDTCPTCATFRMQLIGNPVFPHLFGPGGTVDTANLNLPGWIAKTFDRALTNDTTGMSAAVSQSQDSLAEINGSECAGQIDDVIKSLTNCTTDTVSFATAPTIHPLAIIRNFLNGRCGSGNGTDFTPSTIDSALSLAAASVSGFTRNDLCHAFLVKYGLYSPVPDNANYPYACGDSALYEGLRQFLNRSDVKTAIGNATSFSGSSVVSGLTLSSSNPFENALATQIGSTTFSLQSFDQTIPASTTGGTEFVKLVMTGSTSVSLYLRSKDPSSTLQLNGQTVSTFSTAGCIGADLNSLGSGAIAQNTALVRAVIGSTSYDFYVWTKELPLMTPVDASSIGGAVTCMDLKRAMDQFYADAATYNYDVTINHPLYESTVTNYINYKLQRHYNYNDYLELMKGCAISDKLQTKRYLTSYQIAFSSDASASTFIASLASVGANTQPDYFVFAASGTTYCWLNLGSVDTRDVLSFKTYIDGYSSGVTSRTYLLGGTSDYLFVPDSICSGFSTSTISSTYGTTSSSGAVTVGLSAAYGNYTRYSFAPLGSSPQDYANQEQAVLTAIALTCPSIIEHPVEELLRSADYASSAKQDYLTYIYGKTSDSHDAIIADVAPDMLKTQLSSFSGQTVTYNDPLCQNRKRDLYLFTGNQSGHPGFSRASSTLSGLSTLFPSATATTVSSSLSVYLKANGMYWYRLFDGSDNLYNLYVLPPQHALIALNQYVFDYIRIAGGDDSARYFTVYVHDPAASSVLIPCSGYADFTLGYSQRLSNVILLNKGGDDFCLDTTDCEHQKLDIAKTNGVQAYRLYNDSTVKTLSDSMIRFVVNHAVDTLELCSGAQKYHYTLYYYDRAGNLEKTVPPDGVKPTTQPVADIPEGRESTDTTVNNQSLTDHKKITVYRYNAENKLIYQHSPDAGSTFLFYNGLGDLAFSQTTKQRADGYYTYTIYDGQERPIETGQVQLGCVHTNPASLDLDTARCYYSGAHGFAAAFSMHPPFMEPSNHFSIFYDSLLSIVRSLSRTDVVVTTYDTPRRLLDTISGQHLSRQQNLLHRVSAIEYFPTIAANYPDVTTGGVPQFTTYYSYDLDGNVTTASYDYLPLATIGQRYKRVDYDYDLISGKVNGISANRGKPDQFYQRYDYDADNRITTALSSKDGVIWNKDARYSYYLHGPLAQVQIGDAQIQSLEYAYTINGWLKAINGDVRRPDLDMGQNGEVGDSTYARDIIAHTLTYFNGDYSPIAQTPVTHLAGPTKGLYNGNIAQQITGMANVGTMERDYRYDQLQRLKLATNSLVDDNSLAVTSPTNLYRNAYAYDPDGNITQLSRWDGSGVQFDNFGYNYDPTAYDNKLLSVTDTITSSPSTYTDIKSGQPADNYSYDLAGNLTKDKQGHLKEITWNLAGKVSSITDSVANKYIFFDYDGLGNRIYKEVVTDGGDPGEKHEGEYYLRDASGNILTTYKTNKVYKGTILALDRAMCAGDSNAYWSFLNTDIAALSGFKTVMITEAVTNYSAWVDSIVGQYSPIYYYANNSSWENSLLNNDFSWVDSLRDYETATGFMIYGNALNMATQGNDSRLNMWLGQIAQAGQPELQALMTDFASAAPGAVPIMWMNYGVVPGGTPALSGQNFAAIYPAPPTVANDILNVLNGQPTMSTTFWTYVAADNTIMSSSALRSDPSWTSSLAGMMADYGDPTWLAGFYDSYWVGAQIWLDANVSAQQRLELVYDNATSGLVAAFAHRTGDSLFAGVIAAVSGMNVPYYQTVIAGSPSGVVVYTGYADTMSLAEHHIYGSSRLGMQTYSKDSSAPMNIWRQYLGLVDSTLSARTTWYSYAYGDLVDSTVKEPWGHGDVSNGLKMSRTVGLKYYELSDHLGNVLATVLDRKTGHLPTSATSYDYWNADVATATDYYGFGMEMPGRTYSSSLGLESKFGFNGQMKDNEIGGNGNHLDFKFRGYDSRLGRFWSADPLASKYPWNSPYAFAENNVTGAVDLEGLEKVYVTFRAFIPQDKVKMPSIGGISLSPGNFSYHKGDNRMEYRLDAGHQYRTEQYVFADISRNKGFTSGTVNGSEGLGVGGDLLDYSLPSVIDSRNQQANIIAGSLYGKIVVDVKNKVEARLNPFTPSINAVVGFKITPQKDGSFNYEVAIPKIDGFPAYEMWLNDDKGNSWLLFAKNPIESGKGPSALYGSGEESYHVSGNTKALKNTTSESFSERRNPPQANP